MSQDGILEVNGELRKYPEDRLPPTVAKLLEDMGLEPGKVVAEVNGDIVSRNDFASRALASGDRVELVRFVGGG